MYKIARSCSAGILPTLTCPLVGVRHHSTAYKYNLIEVGKFTTPKATGNYDCGQLFLHKKLDYRGVILFPWIARVFNRNNKGFPALFDSKLKKGEVDDIPGFTKESYTTVLFYQVLLDFRDCPIVSQREGITFLGQKTDNKFYTIPGIDYISHDDVLPYEHSESIRDPIQHNLFQKFLEKKTDQDGVTSYYSTNMLHQFHEDNFDCLRLGDVHCQTTNGVKITVYSFYMGCRSETPGREHWWRYSILIENVGDVTVQLRERTWCIFSNADNKESVTGKGVVGQEPVLGPGQCFQYSSLVSLRSNAGHMWGTYLFQRDDSKFINVSIPPFLLVSKLNTA